MEHNPQTITRETLAFKLQEYSYSVEEFARVAGLNHTTVRRFVRGEDVTHRAATKRRIARGLDKIEVKRARFEQQMHDTKDAAQWL